MNGTACDPAFALQVRVVDPADQPPERAMLVLTDCPRQNEHPNGAGAVLTDARGVAALGGLGTEYPACTVTVMRPGYAAWQRTFDELCGGDRTSCDRVQTRPIVLAPVAASTAPQRRVAGTRSTPFLDGVGADRTARNLSSCDQIRSRCGWFS